MCGSRSGGSEDGAGPEPIEPCPLRLRDAPDETQAVTSGDRYTLEQRGDPLLGFVKVRLRPPASADGAVGEHAWQRLSAFEQFAIDGKRAFAHAREAVVAIDEAAGAGA